MRISFRPGAAGVGPARLPPENSLMGETFFNLGRSRHTHQIPRSRTVKIGRNILKNRYQTAHVYAGLRNMRAYLIRKREEMRPEIFLLLPRINVIYTNLFPLLVQLISSSYYEMQMYIYKKIDKKVCREIVKKFARNIRERGNCSFCGEKKTLEARPEAIRLRQWLCSVVSARQITRKEKEGDGQSASLARGYRHIIPGPLEFKIHVNIIRFAVHFLRLGARTSRGSSYDERARHENRRFDIFGC